MIIKNSLRSKLIQIAIFFSIFSQLPFIRISLGIDTQVITYFCWGGVFFTTLLSTYQNKLSKYFLLLFVFILFFFTCIMVMEVVF